MKCPEGSYAQLEALAKLLVPYRNVKYKQDWRATAEFTHALEFGAFKHLEVRVVDFVGGGNVMVDDYAYQGKLGVKCKAFLFRFVPKSEFDNTPTIRFTFDNEEGFDMLTMRELRESVEPEIEQAFRLLIKKLMQEANCLEGEEDISYPCVVLAKQILAQSTELKKSFLLNNTISMHSAIKDAANRLRDPQYAEDREAMWTLVVSPSPWLHVETSIVCNMYGKYIDCLRAAVCFKPVHDLMFAIHHGAKLSDNIYLLPTLTAYPKDFKPEEL